jgi:hypothetical protein
VPRLAQGYRTPPEPVYMLAANHAPLMMSNSHLYVVDGLNYAENVDTDGGVFYVTHKFLLQDAALL